MGSTALALLTICGLVVMGLIRGRREGRLDPLHPLIYPTVYVTVATLAPTAWLYSRGDLGLFVVSDLPPSTPKLMALAAVGFAVGAAIPFRRRAPEAISRDPKTIVRAGRGLMVLPVALAIYGVATNAVVTRGVGQSTRSLADSLDAAGFIIAPLAVALIAAGRAAEPKPFTRLDLSATLILVVALGLNGRRGAAIAVVLIIAFAYLARPSSRSRLKPLLLGNALLVVFSYFVATYRTRATGQETHLSAVEVVLRDLASLPFTTGVTERLVHLHSEPRGGATILAGLARQLPSPIANNLFGEPNDTGAFVFRRLFSVPDTMGYGYSIPAEGVLNFGTLGAFALPFALGAVFAWLYARADFNATRGVHLAYYVAAATLPFAWRSDVLGATKGILYPVLIACFVLLCARTVEGQRRRQHSRSDRRQRAPLEQQAGSSQSRV